LSTARRPQDLVFTLFGEFLLHEEGPVWVGSLIRLLEPLGLTEGGVRTVLSRMVAKGWLCTERAGRSSYYALSGRGRSLLEEGEARIYRPAHAAWEGEWTLLAYSIPEELRSVRDRLRTRLSWLGFGSLGNGLWISPHAVADRVREMGAELGIAEHVELFRARHEGIADDARLVRQCWDLPAVNVRYEAFVARHLDAYRALQAAGTSSITAEAAYVRRFELVHEYREFPLLDPFLPRSLQPSDWAGECSLALFQAYHALLSEPADAFLRSVVQTLAMSRNRAAM
jgi:phenylacetic acid degradation operon negative regulatory protein